MLSDGEGPGDKVELCSPLTVMYARVHEKLMFDHVSKHLLLLYSFIAVQESWSLGYPMKKIPQTKWWYSHLKQRYFSLRTVCRILLHCEPRNRRV